MRVFAAPFRKTDTEATVAVALEIAASKLNLVETDGAFRGELEIIMAITDARNRRRPALRHRAVLALKPETYARVSRTSMRVLTQVTLPEGRYQLRVSAGGAILAGSVVYDVAVPKFSDDLALSGIALTSGQATETLTVSPHDRLDVTLPGPPTTAREFSRADTLTLFAEVYENRRKPHTVTFTTELRDPSGHVVDSLSMQRNAVERPARTSVHAFSPRLALEDVPAGLVARLAEDADPRHPDHRSRIASDLGDDRDVAAGGDGLEGGGPPGPTQKAQRVCRAPSRHDLLQRLLIALEHQPARCLDQGAVRRSVAMNSAGLLIDNGTGRTPLTVWTCMTTPGMNSTATGCWGGVVLTWSV
jgi:hypothetical protein